MLCLRSVVLLLNLSLFTWPYWLRVLSVLSCLRPPPLLLLQACVAAHLCDNNPIIQHESLFACSERASESAYITTQPQHKLASHMSINLSVRHVCVYEIASQYLTVQQADRRSALWALLLLPQALPLCRLSEGSLGSTAAGPPCLCMFVYK